MDSLPVTHLKSPDDINVRISVIKGKSPYGDRIKVRPKKKSILVCFISTDCHSCNSVVKALGKINPDIDVLLLYKSVADLKEVRNTLNFLNTPNYTAIISDSAWYKYKVLSYPYFVLISPKGDMVRRAIYDETQVKEFLNHYLKDFK
jgi:thioredoxin-related protein